MATLRTSLFSTLAIAGLSTTALAQDCEHYVDAADTFGDGWNGALLDIVNNTNGANSAPGLFAGFTAGGQFTESFLAAPGDVLDTVWTAGGFDNEVSYVVLGGDGAAVCDRLPLPFRFLAVDVFGLFPLRSRRRRKT